MQLSLCVFRSAEPGMKCLRQWTKRNRSEKSIPRELKQQDALFLSITSPTVLVADFQNSFTIGLSNKCTITPQKMTHAAGFGILCGMERTESHGDCYFCLVDVFGFNSKMKSIWCHYRNLLTSSVKMIFATFFPVSVSFCCFTSMLQFYFYVIFFWRTNVFIQ